MLSSTLHTGASEIWQQDLAYCINNIIVMWMEVRGELAATQFPSLAICLIKHIFTTKSKCS
jgi:hypothetical protein